MSLFERIMEKFLNVVDSDNTFYFIMIWFFAIMILQTIRTI